MQEQEQPQRDPYADSEECPVGQIGYAQETGTDHARTQGQLPTKTTLSSQLLHAHAAPVGNRTIIIHLIGFRLLLGVLLAA